MVGAITISGLLSSCMAMPGDSVYEQRPPMVPYVPDVGQHTDTMPMLLDPEAENEEWTEEVFAPDLATAQNRCQNIANKGGLTEVINVTQATKTLNRQGNYKFVCWFKSETGGSSSATDNDNPQY